MKLRGIPAVPTQSSGEDYSFWSAVKENIEGLQTQVNSISTSGSGSTTVATTNFVSLADYGTIVGDDATDNAVAFAAAEADPDVDRVWIPEGTYYTTSTQASLTKSYWGPGNVHLSTGLRLPGHFTNITTKPTQYTQTYTTPWPPDPTPWFGGDNRYVDPLYFRIAQGVRVGTTERYFEGSVIARNVWFENGAGYGGKSSRINGGASSGATSVTLYSVDGLSAGQTLAFVNSHAIANPPSSPVTDTVVIGSVNTGTKVITFSPALTTTYADGDTVSLGTRTHHPIDHITVNNTGGGDVYGSIIRMRQKATPLDGMAHIYDCSTTGQYGGSIIYYNHGTMGTGWESQYRDNGSGGSWDVAVFGQVDTFTRTNDTGARAAIWLGTFMKSDGSVPADVAHCVYGKWRIGLDTVKGDFTSNGNAAVQLGTGQAIYFNGVSSTTIGLRGADPTGTYPTSFGNVLGNSYIRHTTVSSADTIEVWAGSTYRTRTRSDGIFSFNGSIQSGTFVAATNYMQINGGSLFFTGSNTVEIYWDGTNLRATSNARASSVVIV